ncbi:MAG: rod shape-determining protein MreC [Oscillospiraceae bacterium]|nr:rod shape-determining protein MreC [Oscillospiraceae bacterium]
MKEFFHSIGFKILIGIAALLLGLMTYVAVSGGFATLPERLISTVTYPFVTAANAISEGVGGFFDKLVNADSYKAQNDELRAKLSEMYASTMDYEQLKEENTLLREMLGLKEENKTFRFSNPCDVVARNANDIYGGFTINRGSNDGISLYDPVVTSVGLVGRVSEIAPNYSRVTSLLSPQVSVGVFTMRTRATGVIENDLTNAQKGLCLMSNILKDADIEVGDVVATSGNSGLFPEGVIVGTVKEVYDDPNGLSKHALIEPMEDCFDVTAVFAVVDFDGKGLSFDTDTQ